ncbi:hypothetical protein [Methyloceanibacter sp. wino2]|uniref:hypothetical protein n=1 Tax=Methyloceanibacter sp. wino2 TaxID=2170729 RepID=UPI000D3E969B|nr:hypothetical protein [Methyloceanibacter sp. wino2]
MNSLLSVLASMLLVTTAHAASLPGDSANGKRLYDTHCTDCHDTSVLSRPDRAVQSLDELKEQLASCSHMASAEFSATETQDLLKYLNDEFYHFPSER